MIAKYRKLIQKKIIRYVISGGTAGIASLSFLYIFTDIFGMWYLLSSSIAFIIAFFVSFLLQKLWTFKDMHIYGVLRQLSLYFFTALAGLSVNAFFMYVLVDAVGLWYMLAQIVSSGVIAIVTFFIYGNLIFNRTKKNTVLITTGLYPPDIGGPATYTKFLEKGLPEYGFTVSISPFGNIRHLPKIIRHAAYFAHVCFIGSETETIYALDPVSVGFPSFLASRLLRKKFFLRVAGDYAWEQFQTQSAKRKAQNNKNMFITPEEFQRRRFDFITEVRRKIEHMVARHADKIIVPSEYLKKIIIQWGVPEEKVIVIYNTFEPPVLEETRDDIKKKRGLRGKVIISAGRLVPWKGFPALIDVIAELKNEIPDIKLYIAGDGPEKQNLELRIKSYGLQNKVFLTGRLSQKELMQYVAAADVFALNTGYEGFSHQLLEVMALGIPIITTNVGGNPELIENKREGLLVPYNNRKEIKKAMQAVFQDKELRERISREGKEKAKEFTKERAVKELIKLL